MSMKTFEIVCIVFVSCIFKSFALSDVVENVTSFASFVNEDERVVQEWLTAEKNLKKAVSSAVKALLPQIIRSREELDLSSSCSRGMLKFLIGLKQLKLWAFRMFDASGKVPNGMFSGSINTLGDYDGCLDIEVVPENFRGQYCLVELSPILPKRRPFYDYKNGMPVFRNITDPESATGEFMRQAMHFYHLNFRSSVCLPSSCSNVEVQKIVQNALKVVGLELTVTIPNCEIKNNEIVFSTSEIIIIIVLTSLVLMALTGTSLDIFRKMTLSEEKYMERQSTAMKIWLCFSFYSNGRRLLKKDDNPESIKIFHGMKVITILWVILNHTYLYLNYQVQGSLKIARETGKEIAFQLIINGFLNVQTFFFISAVLIGYGVTKMKEKRINIFLYVLRRIWRLTPPFMLVIACVHLLPHIGSGPAWKETITDGLTAKCKKNWWKNLLYFNNFIPRPESCLDWTWYIPVDTHLYFLSLLVIIPLKRNVKVAFMINAALMISGIIASAVTHVYYKLHPTAIYVYSHPNDINYFVENGYYRSYLHISSYSIGISVGYILATRPHMKITKVVNAFGWFSAFSLSLTVLYGVYDWNQGNVPGLFVSTLYACASKIVWPLSLAWVTISCMTGYGGFATTILSWNAFIPLGRLTYMTYLIHPIIQFVYIGSTRTIIRSEHRILLFMYCGNVVLGFITACICSLLFESPFMALEKVLLSATNANRKKERTVEDERTVPHCDNILKKHSFLEPVFEVNSNVFTVNIKKQPNDF